MWTWERKLHHSKELQQREKLFISPKGEDFIKVDLKKKE